MGINKKLVALLSSGVALHSSGINNWAFKKNQALLVLDEIRKINVPILGGDVFLFEDELLVPASENWFCDQLNKETYDEYVLRSINVAKSYIEKMQLNGRVPYFVLVPESDFAVETDEILNELKEQWKKNRGHHTN
ncbi:Imm40 family immunity protein [Pseudodesulfovibrio sp.]|uniref:Imm40 family immunity protein n=1 Tax=unclassified Pseudodesulfovibrio TaxID=2661612 RepID=UPI003B00AF80